MVRVSPDSVLAATQPFGALREVIERDREVARVASRWLEPEARGAKHTGLHERQGSTSNRTSGGCWANSSTVRSRAAKTEMPYVP